MKLNRLASLMLVLPLVFSACIDLDDNMSQKPNDQPTEKPGDEPTDNPEQPGDNPSEEDAVLFTAMDCFGVYHGSIETTGAGLYNIMLSDNGLNGNEIKLNSTYYSLDIYAEPYDGEKTGYVQLPEGTYTLDKADSGVKGTISYKESVYLKTSDTTVEVSQLFSDATLEVTAESITLTATLADVKHIVTFNGQALVLDKRPDPMEDVDLEVYNAWAYYYSDNYSKGVSDNFYLYLSDIDNEYNLLPNAKYYRLDVYSEILDLSNGLELPYGTYTVDASNSRKPSTIAAGDSSYVVVNQYGNGFEVEAPITGGSITVDDSGITAELIVGGAKHKITYKGYVYVGDFSHSGF